MAHARRDQNLFVLDLAVANKIMQAKTTIIPGPRNNNMYRKGKAIVAISRGRPIHPISKSKRVRV